MFLSKRFISVEALSFIEKTLKNNKIVLFMKGTPDKPMCGFSNAVCQILKHNVVDVCVINVLEEQELRSSIKEYSKWPTIPQLYVRGKFVGGCDLVMEMHRSKELASLLGNEAAELKEEEEKKE